MVSRVIGGDQKTLRSAVKGRTQGQGTLASGGVPCRQCDSYFILVTAWNTQLLIRKAGGEEEGEEGRKNTKTTWKLLVL